MKHIVTAVIVLALATQALADKPEDRSKKPPETRKEAQALMDDAAKDFAALQASHKRIVESHERLTQLAQQAAQDVNTQANRLLDLVRDKAAPQALLDAAKSLQEVQMSFTQQYLKLQSQMQSENRSYTAVSNIMKTKHDTVKNSISNIR